MPSAFATRLASGEAKRRSPPLVALFAGGGAAAAAAAVAGREGGGADAASCLLAALPDAAPADAPPEAGAALPRALLSSPSWRRIAIGWLMATSDVPSGTRILPSVPSSIASNSIVAL